MTKKYSTKRALIASALSLVLCFSMLVGTTFAWFTDTAVSAGNIIQTGNLDIEMYWADGAKAVPTTDEGWTDASTGAIFTKEVLWEPGVTQVRHIKIANEGSLALKYEVNVIANGEVSKLADVIDVYYVDPAVQVATAEALANAPKLGTLTEVLAGLSETGNGKLEAGKADTVTIALKMQETAGNEYQEKSIGASFAIQVLATQLASENDSFDNQYDADAPYQAVVNNATDLQVALNSAEPGVEIVLNSDISVTEPIVIPAPAATTFSLRSTPAVTVIDLNGNSINADFASGSTTNHVYAFTNNGNLLLKNGTVNARGIFNYGNMIVEDATINAIDGNGGYAVRNYDGSTFVMNSGKIATTLEDDNKVNEGGYDATTLRVDAGATAEINGGIIDNISDWTFAIDNSGTVVVNGGTVKSIHSTVSNYGTITINGGSFTCNGLEGVTAHALVAWDGSTTTINGGTFDGKDNYNGFNIDAVKGADVIINDGNFLPVHSGSLYGEGSITVKGGVFFDAVKADRLATGYECIQNADGKWIVSVSDLQTAINNAEAGDTIVLNSDVKASAVIMIDKSIVIEGNGHKVTSPATRVFRITASDVDATLNNVNMVSTAVRVSSNDIRGFSVDSDLTNVSLTLNECSVDFTDESAHDWAYAVNVVGGTGYTVTVNGGTYEGANVINIRGAGQTVVVKNATLNSLYLPSSYENMYGACIYVVQNANSSIEVTGTTFNGGNAVAINAGYTPVVESNNVDNTTRALQTANA